MSRSIITLLSDLGTRDATVTIAKAILMRRIPDAVIIDISHNAAPYDLQQAAYLLLSAYGHFPPGTAHLILTDVFAGNAPCMLLAEKEGHFFIAPDNGILPLTFGSEPSTRLCFKFQRPLAFSDWVSDAGNVIATLPAGATAFPAYTIRNAPRLQQPKPMPDGIDCSVLYIDRYGNVVLNITRTQFRELVQTPTFTIKLARLGNITTISNNYSEVPIGDPLCRFNSTGFLEIAINHEHAASLLGLSSLSTSNLRYQSVKIYF